MAAGRMTDCITSGRMTLDEARHRYGVALAARYAPKTQAIYGDSVALFVRWLSADSDAGTREITSVTRADIERYQEHLAASGAARQTQALRVRAVKRFFEWLVERGLLFQSPTQGIHEAPRASSSSAGPRQLPVVLTQGEVRLLLVQPNTGTAMGVRARAVLELLYATGMRRAELVALDVADVDLTAGLVRIRAGKGGKARVVPFGKTAKRWLGEYVRTVRPRLQSRRHRRDRVREHDRAFFLDRHGRRVSGEVVYLTVKDAARSAGIEKPCHVHGLRHAMATHMIAEGADIVTVQKLLGHSDPGITSSVYTRVYPKDLRAEHCRTHPEKDRGPSTRDGGTTE